MKRTLFILLISILLGLISFSAQEVRPSNDEVIKDDFESNPPAATTGVPEEASCVDCHTGSTLPAAGGCSLVTQELMISIFQVSYIISPFAKQHPFILLLKT